MRQLRAVSISDYNKVGVLSWSVFLGFCGNTMVRSALKATIIIRCTVWDELRMFKPIRWIKKYSSGSKKRKLRKREDQLIAKVPKLSSFFVPLVTVKGAVHKVRHARLGGGPRRCESV